MDSNIRFIATSLLFLSYAKLPWLFLGVTDPWSIQLCGLGEQEGKQQP